MANETIPSGTSGTSGTSMKERAEQGQELLKQARAQGEPGMKQPAPRTSGAKAQETLRELEKIQVKIAAKPKKSSAAKSQEKGNANETPPAARGPGTLGDQELALANAAAASVAAASVKLQRQLEADARLSSDPRYERDQEVFELGRAGKLAAATPAPAPATTEAIVK